MWDLAILIFFSMFSFVKGVLFEVLGTLSKTEIIVSPCWIWLVEPGDRCRLLGIYMFIYCSDITFIALTIFNLLHSGTNTPLVCILWLRRLHFLQVSHFPLAASLSSLLITPFPSPSASTSSSSSYQRRWLRSQTTSLENGFVPRRWVAASLLSRRAVVGAQYTVHPVISGLVFTSKLEVEGENKWKLRTKLV